MLIQLIGFAIVLIGIAVLIWPGTVFDYAREHAWQPWLRFLAIAIRLAIGILLVLYAGQSRYPLVLAIIGWLSIAAALVLALIGRERVARFIEWAIAFARPWARVAGVGALALGAFLVYAVR